MLHTIQNKFLSVTVSEQGAELMSVLGADSTEYLWQGDSQYWSDRSPTIFPYVGRLKEQEYSMYGQMYHMTIHGFAASQRFAVAEKSCTRLVLELSDNEVTYEVYPRHFLFRVIYELVDDRLDVTYQVDNRDERTMYFGLGGHPGFNVPLEKGMAFEDYRLRFETICVPEKVVFSSDCFVEGLQPGYVLENGTDIPLVHSMFDDDAIVLRGAGHTVTLESDKGQRSVTVGYPRMDYVGFWHAVHTDAPYVCIEPWCSLPAAKEGITVFEEQKDMISLEPGKQYTNTWWIQVK